MWYLRASRREAKHLVGISVRCHQRESLELDVDVVSYIKGIPWASVCSPRESGTGKSWGQQHLRNRQRIHTGKEWSVIDKKYAERGSKQLNGQCNIPNKCTCEMASGGFSAQWCRKPQTLPREALLTTFRLSMSQLHDLGRAPQSLQGQPLIWKCIQTLWYQ